MRSLRFGSVNFDDDAAVSILVVAGGTDWLRGLRRKVASRTGAGTGIEPAPCAELDFVRGHLSGSTRRNGGLLRDCRLLRNGDAQQAQQ